jgi:hypothetical protein
MSSTNRQYITSTDLKMMDDVLTSAGMHDRQEDPRKQSIRAKAARYLISRFQEGARSPEALKRELCERPGELPMARQILSGTAFVNYEYGKRFETDRTWTVIHVFTGKAARTGSWIMRGLTKETADRLLRTMNHVPAQ